METAITFVLAAAGLALGALLAYHIVVKWRRGEPLPFFEFLKRHRLSVAQAEEAAGKEALAAALQRCELCRDRKVCARALAVDWIGHEPHGPCPNAEFFERLKRA